MSSALNSVVALLNSGKQQQAHAGFKPQDPDKPKKKPASHAPKPRTNQARASGDGGADGGASKLRQRLKGGGPGAGGGASAAAAATPRTAAQPASIAATLVQSAALTAVAPDPTTAPLLKRVKDVLDFLLQHNGSRLSVDAIQAHTRQNLATDAALRREVHAHARITYAGAPPRPVAAADGVAPAAAAALPPPAAAAEWYAYDPEIRGVRNKVELLNYIRDHKGPALEVDPLTRAYLTAAADLQALRAEGRIFIVGHPEQFKETVFVRDMMGQEGVADDVRALWFEVCSEHVKDHVPQGVQELQAAVTKAGLRSALANQPVKRVQAGAPRQRAKKPRQQRINIEKATNAHLPFLFAAAQPKSLDA